MDTVVLVLMLLTAFNFLLKQTFWKAIAVCIIAAICAAFAGLMWPYAIEQSKSQIANWLGNQPLMLDTSVVLSVEVCIQMAYAMLAVHVANDYPVKPRTIVMYRFLRWFPGLLIFPVIFSGLVFLLCISRHFFPNDSLELCRFHTGSDTVRKIPSAISPAGERTEVGTFLSDQCTGGHIRYRSNCQRKDIGGRYQRDRLESTVGRDSHCIGRWCLRVCLVEHPQQTKRKSNKTSREITY